MARLDLGQALQRRADKRRLLAVMALCATLAVFAVVFVWEMGIIVAPILMPDLPYFPGG